MEINAGEVVVREAAPEIGKVDTKDLSCKCQTRCFSPSHQEATVILEIL